MGGGHTSRDARFAGLSRFRPSERPGKKGLYNDVEDWQLKVRDTKSADLDYDDIDVSVDEYTLQPQMYESLTIKTKQITAVHEIGHMLGLEHPLVGVYHPNTELVLLRMVSIKLSGLVPQVFWVVRLVCVCPQLCHRSTDGR